MRRALRQQCLQRGKIKKLSLALPKCAVRYGNSVCSAEKLKN